MTAAVPRVALGSQEHLASAKLVSPKHHHWCSFTCLRYGTFLLLGQPTQGSAQVRTMGLTKDERLAFLSPDSNGDVITAASTIARGCRRWLDLHEETLLKQSHHSQLGIGWWLLAVGAFLTCSQPAYLPSGLHSLTSWPHLTHLYTPGTKEEAGSWALLSPNNGNVPRLDLELSHKYQVSRLCSSTELGHLRPPGLR